MRAASICRQAGRCRSAPCAAGPRVRRSTARMLRRARGELDSDAGPPGSLYVKYFSKACAQPLLAVGGKQRALTDLDHHFRIARVLGCSAVPCLPNKLQAAVEVFPFSLRRRRMVFRLGSGTRRSGTAGRALESSRGYDLLQPCTDSLRWSAAGSSLCPTTCLSGCRARRRLAAGSLDGTRMRSSRRRRRGPPLLGSASYTCVALLCAVKQVRSNDCF